MARKMHVTVNQELFWNSFFSVFGWKEVALPMIVVGKWQRTPRTQCLSVQGISESRDVLATMINPCMVTTGVNEAVSGEADDIWSPNCQLSLPGSLQDLRLK